MLSGEADQLKEYSVGIDALGKPDNYDPRRDSTVRIQVGRLRQKLAEYYSVEGAYDPVIVDLPKGHFKLTCATRPSVGAVEIVEGYSAVAPRFPSPPPAIEKTTDERRRLAVPLLCGGLLLAIAWGAFSTLLLWSERENSATYRAMWTPELNQLWKPVLTSKRPLIVSIADPPFVQFKGFGAYRDMTLNRWEDLFKSPQVAAMRKALNNADIQRNFYYAPIGEVNAAFLIGKLLGPRVPTLSLLRASELSMQQIADNNVLFIGASIFFQDQLRGSPVQLDLVNARPGIRNGHPHPGEPALLTDSPPVGASEDGEAYVLITHVPGPLRTTELEIFTSNRTAGRMAAVEWYTNPVYARMLVSKLRTSSGELPRYYQIVLRVKYKGGVPTETSYVLHHEVQ
jgi:hypothetical protein